MKNTAQYTPGPLRIDGVELATDENLRHAVIRDSNERWVALVEIEDDEGLANSKLMVAAPELLEALQLCLDGKERTEKEG